MEKLNIYGLEKCQRAGPWQGNTWARLFKNKVPQAWISFVSVEVRCKQTV